MPSPIPMPRSGQWHLRSQKDPRWNRQGSYRSLLSDEPPAIPTEAHQAAAELQATLGEAPPDDLRWVSLPYPSPEFKRLFDLNAFAVTERQVDLHRLTREGGLSEISLDFRTAQLSLGKPGSPPVYQRPAQFLGFLDRDLACWQWGWVCESKLSLPSAALGAAKLLRGYGLAHEIPELSYSEIGLGTADDRPWFHGDYLAMVAVHLCKQDFYISGPVPTAPELVMYWLITAPDVPRAPLSPVRRMASAISQAMAAWANALAGSEGIALIRAYAEQRGCQLSQEGDRRVRIDVPSGGYFHVDFHEDGDIAGLDLPEEPQLSQKPSWLGRLLGGTGRPRRSSP